MQPTADNQDEGMSWEDRTGMHTWPRKGKASKAAPPVEAEEELKVTT